MTDDRDADDRTAPPVDGTWTAYAPIETWTAPPQVDTDGTTIGTDAMQIAARVVKGHGTENDFVLWPDLEGWSDPSPALIRALCDRRAGVGGDGLLRVVPTAACEEVADQAAEARWFMDYRNADGSVAEMCGNGVRVFARYLVATGLAEPGQWSVATRGGPRQVVVGESGDITVDMGVPDLTPVTATVTGRPVTAVHMPNPHAVVFLDDVDQLDAFDLTTAPLVEPAGAYPHGVNVELVVRTGPQSVRLRVHERGVGETRSCGTGVAAVLVASVLTTGEGRDETWTIDVPGGRLTATWSGDRVVMSGPAVLVGEVALTQEWLASVR